MKFSRKKNSIFIILTQREGAYKEYIGPSVGELWMRSGARVPIPRGREAAVRAAFRKFLEK